MKNGRNGASTGAISGKHASKRETNIGAVAQIVRVRKSQDYMDYRSAAEQLADLAAESKTQRDPDLFLMSNLTAMCEKLSPSDRKALAGGALSAFLAMAATIRSGDNSRQRPQSVLDTPSDKTKIV